MLFNSPEFIFGSNEIGVLNTALRQMNRAGVTVVDWLSTVPYSVVVASADIDRLRRLYEDADQQLLVLPSQSRCPLDRFFDTLYHLNEGCQRMHSAVLAHGLSDLLRLSSSDAR